MLRLCVSLAVLGCSLARPQHQYQQQAVEIPPHLLRQYIGQQQPQAQQTQVIPRPVAAVPARLPYAVQSEGQYQPQQYQPPAPYQPQPQQYQPQPQAPKPQYRPQPQYQPQRPQEQREPEDYDPNPSYQFGFDVNDDQYTNYQNRKEQRDGDKIKGSYSVVDSDGFIRTVTYTADPKEGFRAEVSRQPTDIVVKVPTPKPQHQQPQQIHQHQPRPQAQQPQAHQLQQAHQPHQAPAQYYRYE